MFRSCGFVFALGLHPIQITCRLAEFSTRGITFSIKLSTPLSSVNPHNFVANEEAQVLGLPVSSTIFLNCRDGTSFKPVEKHGHRTACYLLPKESAISGDCQ
jgi:hypothetical protein